MPKALSISGLVVAVLLVLLCGMDLGLGFPFGSLQGSSRIVMDVSFLISALILGYLSWSTYRELP